MSVAAEKSIKQLLSPDESLYNELRDLSLKIHGNPELSFKEFFAHELLSDFMEAKGFNVERKACGLDTAFIAKCTPKHIKADTPVVNVAFLSEFDALPKIGHACGHNLIAIAGVGAALAFRKAVEEHNLNATVTLLGSPGEEDIGGKINMIRHGALKGIDFALMAHPGRKNVVHATYLALGSMKVEYFGKAAHAAAAPWEGINALDAVLLAFQSVGLLRQQTLPTNRIHGIITRGGDAPNVIPDYTSAIFYIRSEKVEELSRLRERLLSIFDSAAKATGCTVKATEDPIFADVVINPKLAEIWQSHAESLGCSFASKQEQLSGAYGSTDMGNVTQVVPGLHPVFDIGDCLEEIHTEEFERKASTPLAHANAVKAAMCLALTASSCLDTSTLQQVKSDFQRIVGDNGFVFP